MYVRQACNKKKLELDNPSRQQTRKTPTRERKRVRYLQISYQYHLSPRCRHDFPCGPAGRGLRRCCHGTSCKKKADYTRLMYLSQPDHHYYNSTALLMQVTESPDRHTCFKFYSPQTHTVNPTQITRLLLKFINTTPQKQKQKNK